MLASRLASRLAPRLAAFVLTSLASTAVQADDVADFYRGKEVRLIISASIGGGYDIYARAVARHLGAHIPGNPTIVPQNMPAAGGLGAANYLNNVAPKDGTVIALFQNTVPLEPFFENKQAQFDAAKIGWLGTPTTETAIYMFWHSSKIRTLRGRAAAGVRGGRCRRRLDTRLLRPRVQPDLQFQGRLHHRLSRAERDPAGDREWRGRSDGVAVLVKPQDRAAGLVHGGKICFLFQYGSDAHRDLKDVPLALDLLQNQADKTLLVAAGAPLGLGRPFGRRPTFRPTGSPPCAAP